MANFLTEKRYKVGDVLWLFLVITLVIFIATMIFFSSDEKAVISNTTDSYKKEQTLTDKVFDKEISDRYKISVYEGVVQSVSNSKLPNLADVKFKTKDWVDTEMKCDNKTMTVGTWAKVLISTSTTGCYIFPQWYAYFDDYYKYSYLDWEIIDVEDTDWHYGKILVKTEFWDTLICSNRWIKAGEIKIKLDSWKNPYSEPDCEVILKDSYEKSQK